MARAEPSVTCVPNVESCVDASTRPPKTASSRSRRTSARCDASSSASLSATSHRPSAHRRLSLVSSLHFDSSGRSAARPIRRMARAARSARVSPPRTGAGVRFPKRVASAGTSTEVTRRLRSRERHAAMASARAPWPTSSKVSRAVGVAKISREKCRASEAAAETRVADAGAETRARVRAETRASPRRGRVPRRWWRVPSVCDPPRRGRRGRRRRRRRGGRRRGARDGARGARAIVVCGGGRRGRNRGGRRGGRARGCARRRRARRGPRRASRRRRGRRTQVEAR